MTSEPVRQMLLDARVVSQLACPVCLGEFKLEEMQLVCVGCGREFPIVDGIPVLIAGRETSPRA
jgi:uncharacterized protein